MLSQEEPLCRSRQFEQPRQYGTQVCEIASKALVLLLCAVSSILADRAAGAEAQAVDVVTLDEHTLRAGDRHFLGLGVTYFRAVERVKNDRDHFHSDLAFLAGQGFDYVRILSMVGWYEAWGGLEIAPVDFGNRAGNRVAAWPDYWQQVCDAIDIAYDQYGIRTQITVFADAQLMPEKSDRIQHMQTLLDHLEERKQKVILLEVANESWQNGFPGDEGIAEVREFGRYLSERTEIIVALSDSVDAENSSLEKMNRGGVADIATEHFERDNDPVEGTWRHVRAPWRVRSVQGIPPVSNNEPMGPGSSVTSENDPIKIVSAAAFSYIAQLPMYVYHCEAGVFGRSRFEDQPGIRECQNLKRILPADLPNWTPNDGIESAAPFTAFAGEQPDSYWPDVPDAPTGVVRHIGATRDDQFVTLPMGILPGGVVLKARRAMTFDVYDPLTGEIVLSMELDRHEQFTLQQGSGAYIIKGRYAE
jgi:hypothetical protein